MRAELIPVSRDLYSVSERLKEIDDRYELFYNVRLGRYEIYASGALQLTVPRGELDEIERACAAARRAAEKLALERAEEALEQEGSCW